MHLIYTSIFIFLRQTKLARCHFQNTSYTKQVTQQVGYNNTYSCWQQVAVIHGSADKINKRWGGKRGRIKKRRLICGSWSADDGGWDTTQVALDDFCLFSLFYATSQHVICGSYEWWRSITLIIYTVVQKTINSFSFHYSFYKCWPNSVIFGTHYIELICNTTVTDLPTLPT